MIKQDIISAIKRRGGTHISFVELGNDNIEGWKGDKGMFLGESQVAVWGGISEEAIVALRELIEEKVIEFKPAHLLVYLVDGGGMRLPIARTRKHHGKYKKPHWLPVCINLI